MAPPAKHLVARHWRVMCPTHGNVPAKTVEFWINGAGERVPYAAPHPVKAPSNYVEDRGYCDTCRDIGPLLRVLAYAKAGATPEPCDERCMNAQGPTCFCQCQGTCHGRGACTGHSDSPEVTPMPTNEAQSPEKLAIDDARAGRGIESAWRRSESFTPGVKERYLTAYHAERRAQEAAGRTYDDSEGEAERHAAFKRALDEAAVELIHGLEGGQ